MSSNQKKNSNFLIHGGILAIASVLVRIIGMIKRIPLVNIIGEEGSAYFANAYSVYTLLLLFSSYSMPLAVSKMVSVRAASGHWKNIHRIMNCAVLFAVCVGALFSGLAYFGADFFCTYIIKSPMSALALRFLAPTIFISALLGVFRGFFQGLGTTIPTAISQLLEQVVNCIGSVLVAWVLVQYGMRLDGGTMGDWSHAWGAAGGTIGTGLGALVAFLFVLFLYISYSKVVKNNMKKDKSRNESYGKLERILIVTAVPVILSTAVYNLIDVVDSSLFSHYMNSFEEGSAIYAKVWGAYNNRFLLLVHIPVAFSSALSSALVPSLTAAYSMKNYAQTKQKIALTVRATMMISVPCALAFMSIGTSISNTLFGYTTLDVGNYLLLGGPAVVLFSLSTVSNAILQGLNRMHKPVKHSIISLMVHIILLTFSTWALHLDVYGLIISYMVFALCMCVMNFRTIYEIIGYKPNFNRVIIRPLIASLFMVVVCRIIYMLTDIFCNMNHRVPSMIVVLLCIIFGAATYGAVALKIGVLTKYELNAIPMGSKLISIGKKFHIIH